MAPVWRFTDESWRVVELLWHDEGPIAPLAVDALDKALREDDDPLDVLRVRRVFARAYRWVEAGRGRQGGRRESFTTAAARAGQVALDVARPITQARDFGKTLHERLASFDSDDLARMEDGQLLRALRERQGVVIEAYELLDRGRKATSTVLGALEHGARERAPAFLDGAHRLAVDAPRAPLGQPHRHPVHVQQRGDLMELAIGEPPLELPDHHRIETTSRPVRLLQQRRRPRPPHPRHST